ncbi:hypothetical protein PFISCL1PPCAC_1383, partial [Pristionchus fissidentatus]
LDAFMEKYPRLPKIAMTWATEVAHNHVNRLFHFDDQIFAFFKKHREELDRSYVFLLGDHGMRWGSVRNTWIGNREINNPALFVSVPSHLRSQFVPVLKENSGQLLTSFDIHASFVDILNDPNLGAVRGPTGLRGNSLFRPMPPGERSCRSLPIPVQYCLCEWNRTMIVEDPIREEVGKMSTILLNGRLKEEEIEKECKKFEYENMKKMEKIEGTDGIHSIVFRTKTCGAVFKAIVRVQSINDKLNVSLVSDDFTRTNSYGKTAECMNERAELRPICCCK